MHINWLLRDMTEMTILSFRFFRPTFSLKSQVFNFSKTKYELFESKLSNICLYIRATIKKVDGLMVFMVPLDPNFPPSP